MRPRRVAGQRCESNDGPQLLITIKSTTHEESIQALQGKHTVEASALYMAFELGEKNWKLALGDGVRSPSRYTVVAGDMAALLECMAKAKARCGLVPEARECTAVMRPGATASGCTVGSSGKVSTTS